MYRQILVADEDQKYQQILCRNNSNENIHTYKLKTVTYGLASASFLATRCIKQIALDNKDNPNLSKTLQEDIYMDDLLPGSDTPNNAIFIYWDSPIPQQLTDDWLKLQKAFNEINYLTVPRWVILTADNTVELHGFADASSLAYAAAIYCRQKHNGKIKGSTTCIKNKSSPCQTSFYSSIGVVRCTFTIQAI
ncbi:uncharacterized protein TNCV_3871291 [Trichonephila clavipes]|nr:uncharacterized protein TNCV_3871291 [Trichonephila clavipes]